MGSSSSSSKVYRRLSQATYSQVLQLPMRIAKMKTFTVAAAVLASLVSESFGAECSGPGALCAYQSSGAEVCSPCPAGYSCRPWVSTSGNPGNGKCQSDYCLGPGDVSVALLEPAALDTPVWEMAVGETDTVLCKLNLRDSKSVNLARNVRLLTIPSLNAEAAQMVLLAEFGLRVMAAMGMDSASWMSVYQREGTALAVREFAVLHTPVLIIHALPMVEI